MAGRRIISAVPALKAYDAASAIPADRLRSVDHDLEAERSRHSTKPVTSPRFTLRQLEIFVAVARTLNVTRAAELVHLTPSATSAAITELERAMAADLCVRRKGRGVQLTSEGYLLERLAARILGDASEMANAVSEFSSGTLQGTLRIGCSAPLSASVLPAILQGFTCRFPSVDLELVEETESTLHDMMLDGLVDVVLGCERVTDDDLESTYLTSLQPKVIVPERHRFAHRDRIGLTDLADEPLILLDAAPGKQRIMSWFADAGVDPRVRFTTRDAELAREMVGRGLGYSLVTQPRTNHPGVDDPRVRTLKIDTPHPSIDVFLSAPSAARTGRVRAFIDFAEEARGQLPPMTDSRPYAAAILAGV